MIEIHGESDDCIEVDIGDKGFEFYADPKGCWQADLVGPGGTDQLRIRAEFDPDKSGCWVISLSQTDESVPFPPWGNGIEQAPSGYSTLIRIDAPEGTRLANIKPEPS
jgi:hypothetical protein